MNKGGKKKKKKQNPKYLKSSTSGHNKVMKLILIVDAESIENTKSLYSPKHFKEIQIASLLSLSQGCWSAQRVPPKTQSSNQNPC